MANYTPFWSYAKIKAVVRHNFKICKIIRLLFCQIYVYYDIGPMRVH